MSIYQTWDFSVFTCEERISSMSYPQHKLTYETKKTPHNVWSKRHQGVLGEMLPVNAITTLIRGLLVFLRKGGVEF